MARKRRGRGEGSIYQRSDGWYVASVSLGFTPAGKRRRKTVYGRTKQEVAERLRAVQHAADVGRLPNREDLTVAGWAAHWLKVIEPTVEPKTLVPYRSHVDRYVAPRIGKTKLSKLRRADVQSLYADLLADGVSAAMVRKVGTTLTAALNAAVQAGELPTNPAAKLKKPKAPKPRATYFTPEQVPALVKACDGPRLGPMFLLMLDAGCGPGETFALTWGDLDTDARTVTVSKSLEEIAGRVRVKATKNDYRVRTVTISEGTAAALVRHRERMRAEGHSVAKDAPAFVGPDGGRLISSNVRSRSWLPLLKTAGLPPHNLYALRHTCATLLLLAGVGPKVVAERLGHASVSMVLNTYGHVIPAMQQQAADVMGRWTRPGG